MQKHKPKWLPITGNAEASESLIRYVGVVPPKKKLKDLEVDVEDIPRVVLRSDEYFQDGDITCEAFIENSKSKIQFRLGNDGKHIAFIGINLSEYAYGIVCRENSAPKGEYIAQSRSGFGNTPPTAIWFSLHIRVRGSNIELFIDNIRVANCQFTLSRSQLEIALSGVGEVKVRNIVVSYIRPQIFVVMQFTDEFNQLFKEVIYPVCDEFGYQVIRGDNVYTNGLIIQDIAQSIQNSSIIIADITPDNANVYYEVGYAHGIEKPTILLCDRKREKLPFDISGFRLLFYDNTIAGKSEVENSLRKHLEAIRA
jgi:hypothetical protein